jgi:putative transposase
MPCIPRRQVAALHRVNGGAAFLKLLGPAKARHPIQAFGFFLVVAPCAADALSPFMQWWMTSHVRRYHRHYQQRPNKAFDIQTPGLGYRS